MNLYNEYVELEDQIKALETKKLILREQILNDLQDRGGKPVRTEHGLFSKVAYEIWEYSQTLVNFEKKANEKIKLIKEEISTKKDWARNHGKATLVDTNEIVRFTRSK
jgi:adenine C2-methylase RlmN of 23S rRNA A2503 and tRNA A37